MVKEVLYPSEGTPFHKVPDDPSYPPSQPPMFSPQQRSPVKDSENFQNQNQNQIQNTNQMPKDSSRASLEQQNPYPTVQSQQLPVRKLDETYENQMLLAQRNATTTSNTNTQNKPLYGQQRQGSGAIPTLHPGATSVGGVPQFPEQRVGGQNFMSVSNPMPQYLQQAPQQQQPVAGYDYQANNRSIPPPFPAQLASGQQQQPWMGHLHLVVQSPPLGSSANGGLQDYKIDEDTAKSMGAQDFNSFLKSKIRELGASTQTLRKFDPETLHSRPITDAVSEILSSQEIPNGVNPPITTNNASSMLNKQTVKQLDKLDGENAIDGPPIDLSHGSTKSKPSDPMLNDIKIKKETKISSKVDANVPVTSQNAVDNAGIPGAIASPDKQYTDPPPVSEAVIYEGLAESILEQDQSTVAVLTLVTTELKTLYDKLVDAVVNAAQLNSANFTAGMPNGPVPVSQSIVEDDLDADTAIAEGLKSIVGFILGDNITRLKVLCQQSSLLYSMQTEAVAQFHANNPDAVEAPVSPRQSLIP